MNWKQEAKEKLRKYEAMRMATINIPQEIERLEGEYTAIRSARTDGNPVQGGSSAREDAIINNIMERQELEWTLESATRWVKQVNRALDALQPDEKNILRRLYIYQERGAIACLCKELGVENSSIYRRRDRALHTFTLALYGATGKEYPLD